MKKVSKRKIYNIAKPHIYELEERGDLQAHNSDSEDFLDVAVWSLEKALVAAYEQGKLDAQKAYEKEKKDELKN
ncbi:DUF6900 domain-containing protein [Lactococcus insecticola]|uniref:DUF6900 domain-containing protein n=1 Tax=Pseudolactococcus insecticola TaxID=2709158 RepID=A0A6A0B6E2_9LACT|nr:hypothetical protein [Lactococcus insecticola]GFH40243.1 hypothetical protein Hs20B_06410 [Lactococcus insecticola]